MAQASCGSNSPSRVRSRIWKSPPRLSTSRNCGRRRRPTSTTSPSNCAAAAQCSIACSLTSLKMVLDQGYWPDSILTAPTDEAIQYDIRATKEMGFNGARKHQKLEDPRYLYWADHMGFLVSRRAHLAANAPM